MKKYFYVFFLIFSILIPGLLVFNPLNNFFHENYVNANTVITERNISPDNFGEENENAFDNATSKEVQLKENESVLTTSQTESGFSEINQSNKETYQQKNINQNKQKKIPEESECLKKLESHLAQKPEEKNIKSEEIENIRNIIGPFLFVPEGINHFIFNPLNGFFYENLVEENLVTEKTDPTNNVNSISEISQTEKENIESKKINQKKREEIKNARRRNVFISGEIRHIEAKGIGYDRGYSTCEVLFFPKLSPIDWSMFFDLRIHYFNNGIFASNAGTGFRYFTRSRENIFGFNIYYDFRDTRHNFQIHQIGIGGEIFRDRFEARLNLYFPLNNNKFLTSSFQGFSGGYVLTTKEFEESLKSVFVEGGYWIEKTDHLSVYGAVSQYFLHRNRCAVGGKTRIKIELQKYLSLEGSVSYDCIFNTRFQGQISLCFPLGGSSKKSKRSLSQRVHRNEIIPVAKTNEFNWNW